MCVCLHKIPGNRAAHHHIPDGDYCEYMECVCECVKCTRGKSDRYIYIAWANDDDLVPVGCSQGVHDVNLRDHFVEVPLCGFVMIPISRFTFGAYISRLFAIRICRLVWPVGRKLSQAQLERRRSPLTVFAEFL